MDTLESVLGRAHKVLIDGKAGSNMIYLPIDKLLEKSNARDGEPSAADAAAAGAKEPDQVTVEARGRGER
jgi:membrane protease subunit HflK